MDGKWLCNCSPGRDLATRSNNRDKSSCLHTSLPVDPLENLRDLGGFRLSQKYEVHCAPYHDDKVMFHRKTSQRLKNHTKSHAQYYKKNLKKVNKFLKMILKMVNNWK